MKNKSMIFKNVFRIITGLGVGKVVDDILAVVLPAHVSLPIKILHKIGAYSLSWVIGDWASDMLADQIEDMYNTTKTKIAEAQKEMEGEANG